MYPKVSVNVTCMYGLMLEFWYVTTKLQDADLKCVLISSSHLSAIKS